MLLPHSLNIIEKAGFLTSVGSILRELQQEKPNADSIWKIAQGMKAWFDSHRSALKQTRQVDPEVERLRAELAKKNEGEESKKVDSAYSEVVAHAGPEIDRIAKPIVGKFGFTPEENKAFRQAVWNHLQETRNAHADYKTIAPAKQKQGLDKWGEYAKRWTTDNAEASIRAVLKTPPWSRLAGATKVTTPVVKTPGTVAPQTGKQPSREEIDYGPKGLAAARRAGFKDVGDMLMSGQAPLVAGGIRKWR